MVLDPALNGMADAAQRRAASPPQCLPHGLHRWFNSRYASGETSPYQVHLYWSQRSCPAFEGEITIIPGAQMLGRLRSAADHIVTTEVFNT